MPNYEKIYLLPPIKLKKAQKPPFIYILKYTKCRFLLKISKKPNLCLKVDLNYNNKA